MIDLAGRFPWRSVSTSMGRRRDSSSERERETRRRSDRCFCRFDILPEFCLRKCQRLFDNIRAPIRRDMSTEFSCRHFVRWPTHRCRWLVDRGWTRWRWSWFLTAEKSIDRDRERSPSSSCFVVPSIAANISRDDNDTAIDQINREKSESSAQFDWCKWRPVPFVQIEPGVDGGDESRAASQRDWSIDGDLYKRVTKTTFCPLVRFTKKRKRIRDQRDNEHRRCSSLRRLPTVPKSSERVEEARWPDHKHIEQHRSDRHFPSQRFRSEKEMSGTRRSSKTTRPSLASFDDFRLKLDRGSDSFSLRIDLEMFRKNERFDRSKQVERSSSSGADFPTTSTSKWKQRRTDRSQQHRQSSIGVEKSLSLIFRHEF